MYFKINLIHKNTKKLDEINYLSENAFLIKRMGLADSLRLIIKPLTDTVFLDTKLFISALFKKKIFVH